MENEELEQWKQKKKRTKTKIHSHAESPVQSKGKTGGTEGI